MHSLSRSFADFSQMNRFEFGGTFNKWKWPFVGVTAAFVGSLYTLGFSQSSFLVHANSGDEESKVPPTSLGLRDLLQKLISGFVQGPKMSEKPPLSPNEASNILRGNEKRININCGVISYFETCSLASNNPSEDRNIECQLLKSNGSFFGVFDGHGGWHCAQTVRTRLPLYVALSLLPKSDLVALQKGNEVEVNPEEFLKVFGGEKVSNVSEESTSKSTGYTLSQKQDVFHTGPKYLVKNLNEKTCEVSGVPDSLSIAFTQLDDDICTEAIPVKVLDDAFLTGASGSCAVTAYVEGQHLYVSNTGDCRAVLGSISSDGSWFATPLSHDQTAQNFQEVQRVQSEHPGEEAMVIRNGRLLGQLQPLRAFGDIQYKWDKITHSHILNQVYGGPIVPPSLYKTPPYLTARPVISHHHLQKKDKFVILATDGLWDVLSSEQAVTMVGQFMDNLNGKVRDETILEQNAATHLIRQAIGGNDHHFVAQMLLVPDQYRRNWRDDITVTVVFFNSDSILSKL